MAQIELDIFPNSGLGIINNKLSITNAFTNKNEEIIIDIFQNLLPPKKSLQFSVSGSSHKFYVNIGIL